MSDVQQISELTAHALAKKGTHNDSASEETSDITLHGAGQLFWVYKDNAYLPVLKEVLSKYSATYPAVEQHTWPEKDGHVYMKCPLDAGVPTDVLKSWIDDAYAIVWNKLDEPSRRLIDVLIELSQRYDDSKLIDSLINIHGLDQKREAIRMSIRPAILLRPKEASEPEMPLGVTKVGGRPDLPPGTDWPIYYDHPELFEMPRPPRWEAELPWPPLWVCRPLAFLTQIDLAEIALLGTPLDGLPRDGLLSVFSGWGWVETHEYDFMVPPDEKQEDYTIVLHTPPNVRLERLKIPPRVNSFPAAAVDPIPILTIPYMHRPWPESLVLTDEERNRYSRLTDDYRTIQNGHWLKRFSSLHVEHQLGGYVKISQGEYNAPPGFIPFLQIGPAGSSDMSWGDDGELTFFVHPDDLAQGRHDRIWGDWQCG